MSLKIEPWAILRNSQDSRPKIMGLCAYLPITKMLGSCLNFPRLETRTNEQLFELPRTQEQNFWAVV